MNGISLVVPFYNEEQVLESTLREIWSYLSQLNRPFEILLGDDGSRDASARIAEKFRLEHSSSVQVFANAENRGRGSILSKGFALAKMPIVLYIDADLEIELRHIPTMLRLFDLPEVNVTTGTKLRAPQPLNRARHRKLASYVFNALVRLILNSPVSDHQCGLKGFRREVIISLLPSVKEEGWAWDTEVLLLAQKRKYAVHEFPVELESKRKSTVPFFKTIFMFTGKILEFRKRGLAL